MISKLLRRTAWSFLGRLNRLASDYERDRLRRSLGHVGVGGTLARDLHITGQERVWLGDNVHIGRGAWIRAEGGLRVGSNTHISRNVVIYTVNHDFRGKRIPYDEALVEKPVDIGENVWIGMNVTIAPGTVIGEGAIVALGACVSGVIPPLAIVGHAKWRVLGERDPDHYDRLKRDGAFGAADGVAFRPAR